MATVHQYGKVDEVLHALAGFIASASESVLLQKDHFNLVLSGGNSPSKLYTLLSTSYQSKMDWSRVNFFFGDERYVPLDHPDSNFRMAKDTLLDPLKILKNRIFAVDTILSPDEAAADYEKRIQPQLEFPKYSFDLVLLGLGDNAHTASLFPRTTVLKEKKALVKAVYVDEVGMYRVTLTAPAINASRNVAFLVYGESKAEAVRQILRDPRDIDRFPAQLIEPTSGALHWFVDRPAAALLN
jgi:6-phosphogluconolactonase